MKKYARNIVKKLSFLRKFIIWIETIGFSLSFKSVRIVLFRKLKLNIQQCLLPLEIEISMFSALNQAGIAAVIMYVLVVST